LIFLPGFEFAPEHTQAFDELLLRLRASKEWQYVEREVEIRLNSLPQANRDRENPHESPLPHHPASGSAQGGSSESFRNQNPLGF
jgi:hypothetical protein